MVKLLATLVKGNNKMIRKFLFTILFCLVAIGVFAADEQIQGRDNAKKRYIYVQVDTLGYLIVHPTLTFPQDSTSTDSSGTDSLVFSTPLTGFELWSDNSDVKFYGVNTKYTKPLKVEVGGVIRVTDAVVRKIYFKEAGSAVRAKIYLWGTQQ